MQRDRFRSTEITFASVAKVVARRATNLLATGLIVILGIIMGRQMLAAWRGPSALSRAPARTVQPPVAERHSSEQPQWIRFGDFSGSFLRTEVEGDMATASKRLRHQCSIAARGTSRPWNAPVALQPWLKTLDQQEPVEREAGEWSLYELRTPLPMTMVIADAPVASSGRQLLLWGLALPGDSKPVQEAKTWTTFVFSAAPGSPSSPERQLPLPDGCAHLISLQDRVRTITGFSSGLELSQVAAAWDSRATNESWKAEGSWQVTSTSWHRRYLRADGTRCDVQFSSQAQSGVLGFCLCSKDPE